MLFNVDNEGGVALFHTNPRAVVHLGLEDSGGARVKKHSELCDQLVRGKLNREGSCLCPSSCKQLQNKPVDPCAEKRLWACVNPESTWLDACGQEMQLLGLSVPGLYDRHELLQAMLSPFCEGSEHWAPLPGVPHGVTARVLGLSVWHTVHFQLELIGAGGGSESNH